MTNISKPIIFFGTEDFSLIALQALLKAGFPIVAVVTKPDSARGRGHQLSQPAVKTFATENNIPVWQPTKLSEVNDKIKTFDQPIGVLVSYGKIIPESTLDLFTPGIINLHPSLLPKYRGASPIESAIIMGEKETGISIMKLVAAMDAGPVYKQIEVPLTGKEIADDLYTSLGEKGANLLIEALPLIIDGTLKPSNQDDSAVTYCQPIQKTDGIIDWNEDAKIIEARIRAYHIWPKSRTKLGDVEVIITKAEAVNDNYGDPGHVMVHADQNNELTVDAGHGALRIISLKPIDKKEMPVSAFLAGYRSQLDV
jgi:methionyl-tRNA formyltransferase